MNAFPLLGVPNCLFWILIKELENSGNLFVNFLLGSHAIFSFAPFLRRVEIGRVPDYLSRKIFIERFKEIMLLRENARCAIVVLTIYAIFSMI
jgi:hypothetical protein